MTTTETIARDAAWTVYESPLGPLTLIGGPRGLSSLRFPAADAALERGARDLDADADASCFAPRSSSSTSTSPATARASTSTSTYAARRSSSACGSSCARSPTAPRPPTHASPTRWTPRPGPRRRRRGGPHPGPDHRPLPPRARVRRIADRLRRRPAPQASPARPRGEPAHARVSGPARADASAVLCPRTTTDSIRKGSELVVTRMVSKTMDPGSNPGSPVPTD